MTFRATSDCRSWMSDHFAYMLVAWPAMRPADGITLAEANTALLFSSAALSAACCSLRYCRQALFVLFAKLYDWIGIVLGIDIDLSIRFKVARQQRKRKKRKSCELSINQSSIVSALKVLPLGRVTQICAFVRPVSSVSNSEASICHMYAKILLPVMMISYSRKSGARTSNSSV